MMHLSTLRSLLAPMTPKERAQPNLLNMSRKRIARGAGRDINEVNQMIKQFHQMSKMMNDAGRERPPNDADDAKYALKTQTI